MKLNVSKLLHWFRKHKKKLTYDKYSVLKMLMVMVCCFLYSWVCVLRVEKIINIITIKLNQLFLKYD